MIEFQKVIGILGLIFIITGNLMIYKKMPIRRKYTYPLLILGGLCLGIYSIYLGDIIFIVLQGVFILASIYGLIRINKKYLKHVLKDIT